jgi:hypothetical protein
MRESDFDRLLAMLGILIALGINPTVILVLGLGYLWGRSSR